MEEAIKLIKLQRESYQRMVDVGKGEYQKKYFTDIVRQMDEAIAVLEKEIKTPKQ